MPETATKCPMVAHMQRQLRFAMFESGTSQTTMAELLGCCQSTVSKALTGPKLEVSFAARIAAALSLEWGNVDGLTLVPRTEPF